MNGWQDGWMDGWKVKALLNLHLSSLAASLLKHKK